jgi:hypothetical protein
LRPDSRPCHDSGQAQPRARAPIPEKLTGDARRAWEESILVNGDLQGSRRALVRVLLEDFCWGKCWCYPGGELLARKLGVGTATITRCLRDLVGFGVIRIVRDRGRRWIVFLNHECAGAFLASLAREEDPVDQNDRSIDQNDQPVDHADQRSSGEKPQTEEPRRTVAVVSSCAPSDQTPAREEAIAEAIKAADGLVDRPEPAVRQILRDEPETPPEAIGAACDETRAKATAGKVKGRLWPYVLGILAKRRVEGWAAPAPLPKPKPGRVDLSAQLRQEREEEARRPKKPLGDWRTMVGANP